MGFGNSGAPEAGVVSPEQRQADAPDAQGAAAAAGKLDKDTIAVEADDGLVSYVAAAQHANSRWLVKAGEVVKTAIPAGVTTGIIPLVKREGDIWAKFINGVMVTDDPVVIDWCASHTTICRRSDDPSTKGWATLKGLQARKANREQLIDASEMDADEAFPADLTSHIRNEAAKSGSPGSDAVENAELTKEGIREQRARADKV